MQKILSDCFKWQKAKWCYQFEISWDLKISALMLQNNESITFQKAALMGRLDQLHKCIANKKSFGTVRRSFMKYAISIFFFFLITSVQKTFLSFFPHTQVFKAYENGVITIYLDSNQSNLWEGCILFFHHFNILFQYFWIKKSLK